MKYFHFFLTLIIFCSFIALAQQIKYPETKKGDVTDTYFGTVVPDPYRWLEDDRAPEVVSWVEQQNAVTFGYLDQIPFRKQIFERLQTIYNYTRYSAPFRDHDNYFFYKNDGLQNQSVLYIQKGISGTPEIFIDPNTLSADGTVQIGGLTFSDDGKYCAYTVSKSGSDWQELNVMDVAAKTVLSDKVEWVKFSSAQWYKNGFFYSRYDAPANADETFSAKNEFHKVYYHSLGDPQGKDKLVFLDEKNPLYFYGVGVSEDEKWLFLFASGQGIGNALYFKNLEKDEKDFTTIETSMEAEISPLDNFGETFLAFTTKDAPNGKVVAIDVRNPKPESWKTLIPESKNAMSSVTAAGGKIFVTVMQDVAHHVYVYNYNGTLENEVQLPALGSVSGFGGKKEDTSVFYTFTSFTFPSTIFQYDIAAKTSTVFRKPQIDFNPDLYEVKQVFYPSKDGTKIPMFIVHKKGLKLDGTNQTLLYGYGGFNISLTPSFSPLNLFWLEQGGVYAIANLRGGGEYGEAWHLAGTKLNKQNVFDDFIAAAEYLIAEKYTSSERLAIQGGSNGGLLVGAVMCQRPDLCKVAIPQVGVMDMLRYHQFTIGWNWASDYGSSQDPTEFAYLYKYSPIHNLKAGVQYPATLITTADHDDRVVPAHSFKFAATLQEKHSGTNPVLIRIETKSGHGSSSTTKRIEVNADMYSFILYNMGITPKF